MIPEIRHTSGIYKYNEPKQGHYFFPTLEKLFLKIQKGEIIPTPSDIIEDLVSRTKSRGFVPSSTFFSSGLVPNFALSPLEFSAIKKSCLIPASRLGEFLSEVAKGRFFRNKDYQYNINERNIEKGLAGKTTDFTARIHVKKGLTDRTGFARAWFLFYQPHTPGDISWQISSANRIHGSGDLSRYFSHCFLCAFSTYSSGLSG